MKWFITVALWLAVIGLGIFSGVHYVRANVKMANLDLADDSSTPEQKAKFLRAFLADMDEAGLPSHAAWIWTSERNKIANQRVVIESLLDRCDALAPLDKSSFGYAQGMTQLTGQEFDHTMNEVKAIYVKAYTMRVGWFGLHGWIIVAAVAGITSFIVYVSEA